MSAEEIRAVINRINHDYRLMTSPMSKFLHCSMDVQYVETCLDLDDTGLAKRFLEELYSIPEDEIVVYLIYRKCCRKKQNRSNTLYNLLS